MVNDVLRLRLPLQQFLDTNLRMLTTLEILESGHAGPLHRLHKSRPCLRFHEHSLGFAYIHPAASNGMAARAFAQRETRSVANIHEWSYVC